MRKKNSDDTTDGHATNPRQGADVIYNEPTFPALVSTLSDRRLCSDKTLVYLATMLVCFTKYYFWASGEIDKIGR